MRRLIILFMLCLLPVQISWAVVSDYAAHEPNQQHSTHYHDGHVLASTFDLDLPSQHNDSDPAQFGHDHCHLSGFIGLLATTELNTASAPDCNYLQSASPVFTSQIFDRPERPKWLPLA